MKRTPCWMASVLGLVVGLPGSAGFLGSAGLACAAGSVALVGCGRTELALEDETDASSGINEEEDASPVPLDGSNVGPGPDARPGTEGGGPVEAGRPVERLAQDQQRRPRAEDLERLRDRAALCLPPFTGIERSGQAYG